MKQYWDTERNKQVFLISLCMVLLNSRQRNNHPVFLRHLPSLHCEESIQLCIRALICRQRARRHTKGPQVLKLITHINE